MLRSDEKRGVRSSLEKLKEQGSAQVLAALAEEGAVQTGEYFCLQVSPVGQDPQSQRAKALLPQQACHARYFLKCSVQDCFPSGGKEGNASVCV